MNGREYLRVKLSVMGRHNVLICLFLVSLFSCTHNPVVRTEYQMRYEGVSYPETTKLEIYLSAGEVPYLYDWIGDIARYGESASYEKTMEELKRDAMKVGAHAVIVTKREIWNQTGAKMIRGKMIRYRVGAKGEPLLKPDSQ